MSSCQIIKLTVGWLQTNCYLIVDRATQEGLIIDPGGDPKLIIDTIKQHSIQPIAIINTHGHGDHIGGNAQLSSIFNVPIWIHEADANMLTNSTLNLSANFGFEVVSPSAERFLNDQTLVDWPRQEINVLHTPGHSRGSICLLGDGWLISGDTLFNQSIGRTDLPGGDLQQLLSSIKDKLICLPDAVSVYPGHGAETTIGYERANNGYLC